MLFGFRWLKRSRKDIFYKIELGGAVTHKTNRCPKTFLTRLSREAEELLTFSPWKTFFLPLWSPRPLSTHQLSQFSCKWTSGASGYGEWLGLSCGGQLQELRDMCESNTASQHQANKEHASHSSASCPFLPEPDESICSPLGNMGCWKEKELQNVATAGSWTRIWYYIVVLSQ